MFPDFDCQIAKARSITPQFGSYAVFPYSATLLILMIWSRAQVDAAIWFDSERRAKLEITVETSSAKGHALVRFAIGPLHANEEVSSIDASSGDYGFYGTAFRQVEVFGLPTVFADRNNVFPAGEHPSADSQFIFKSEDLTIVAGSAAESNLELRAAFTGFEPFNLASIDQTFAQIVVPVGSGGVFSGAFAVRSLGGGMPKLALFENVQFSSELAPGDFNGNGVVDAADYVVWRKSDGTQAEYDTWRINFGRKVGAGGGATVSAAVPEPGAVVLMILAGAGWRLRQCRDRQRRPRRSRPSDA